MPSNRELPTLSGARVTIRPPRGDELDDLADKIAADPQTSQWWSGDAQTIRRWFGEPDWELLVVEEGGEVVGVVGFEEVDVPEHRSVGIDIGLLSCCIGRGVGTETLRLLARWLIEERGHHRLTIDPAVDNARAIRAYERVGFRPVGVMRQYERGADGTWHDGLLMDMLADELT